MFTCLCVLVSDINCAKKIALHRYMLLLHPKDPDGLSTRVRAIHSIFLLVLRCSS